MTDRLTQKDREARIDMILADIDYSEQVLQSWFYHLDDVISCSFKAQGRPGHASSWPGVSDEVTVVSMDEGACDDMYAMVELEGDAFSVPLDEMEIVEANARTCWAITDWHYWSEYHR